jgi:hypothetical protein
MESSMAQPATRVVDLEREVSRFELHEKLTEDEFETYFRVESEFEVQLLQMSALLATSLDFEAAREVQDQVIELNRTLRRKAQRELDRADPAPATGFREKLLEWRAAADGFALNLEGQRLELRGEELRLQGSLEAAIGVFGEALQRFDQLSGSDFPQRDAGRLRLALLAAVIKFNQAVLEMRTGNYTGAVSELERAEAAFEEILAELGQDDSDDYPDVERRVGEQLDYARAIHALAEFFRQMESGNKRAATEYGEEAVDLCSALYTKAVASQTPRQVENFRQMEMEQMKGWLHWAQAEHAIDTEQWSDCRQLVRRARGCWSRSMTYGARNHFSGYMTQSAEGGNLEMLLHLTLSRCEREERMRREIRALGEQVSHLRSMVVINRGGVVGGSGDSYQVEGGAGIVGGQGHTVHGGMTVNDQGQGQRVHGDQIQGDAVAGDKVVMNLRALAPQLTELREVMAQGAASDAEQAAVARVGAAAEAAGKGDEQGVRSHLAAAGRWALRIAESIGLPVAIAALKASLGLPN